MKPVFVAIGGGSGSGKSTLCQLLQAKLGSDVLEVVSLDRYFYPDATTNNRPECIQADKARADLASLRDGKTVSFTSRGRQVTYRPRPLIIVEGHLVLSIPELQDFFDLTIYVDMEPQERIMRRIERNVAAGADLNQVIAWYRQDAQPGHWECIEPTKQEADLILWGNWTERRVEKVSRVLLSLLGD